MAQNPLSHVAAWLAPARTDVVEDPIIALIAEEERIRCAAINLQRRCRHALLRVAASKASRASRRNLTLGARARGRLGVVSGHPAHQISVQAK
jgi:hypothetical protein